MRGQLVDTSAWYTWLDKRDPLHGELEPIMRRHRATLVTTDYVFDETLTLLRYKLGWPAARRWGEAIRGGKLASLEIVTSADREAAWALFCRRHDQRLSFTDCTSHAVMQRIGLEAVITLDSDFRSLGFHTLP